jgi:hypothetical protein
MDTTDRMLLGAYEFAIESASFRYISDSDSGPGWDFDFSGSCINDNPEDEVFPHGARLYTEAAPIPLEKAQDYTGDELHLPEPYDDATGEPFFGLKVCEEYDVSDLRLRFVERDGRKYLIEITATVAEAVFGHPEQLRLSAWTEQLPDHSYRP